MPGCRSVSVLRPPIENQSIFCCVSIGIIVEIDEYGNVPSRISTTGKKEGPAGRMDPSSGATATPICRHAIPWGKHMIPMNKGKAGAFARGYKDFLFIFSQSGVG
jgi:hypothetical protein